MKSNILEESSVLFKQKSYNECISLLDEYKVNLEDAEDYREVVLVYMTKALCYYNKVAKNGVCTSEDDKAALISAISNFEKVRYYYSSYREVLMETFESLVSKASFLDVLISNVKACFLIGKALMEIYAFEKDDAVQQGVIGSKSAIDMLTQVKNLEPHVSKDRKIPYELLPQCFLIKGQCETVIGEYTDAEETLHSYIKLMEEDNELSEEKKQSGLAIGYHHMGNLQTILGNNELAIQYYSKSIDKCENLMMVDFKQHLVDHVIESHLKRAKVLVTFLLHLAEEPKIDEEKVRECSGMVCNDYEFVIRNRKEKNHLYKLKYYRFILTIIDRMGGCIEEEELSNFYERAYSLINDCLEYYENNSKLYQDLAKCTSKMDEEDSLESALELYDTSIKLMTLNNHELTLPMKKFIARSHFERGVLYVQKDQMGKALDEFNFSLQFSPSFADSLYNRGIVKTQLGQLDSANEDFKKATSLNLQDLEAFRQWFLNLREQGKNKEAEKVAEHVFEKISNSETPLEYYLTKIETGELKLERSNIREL